MKIKNQNILSNLSGPYMISWDITNRCNFNCKHCLNRSGDKDSHNCYKDELSEEEVLKVCDQIIEVKPYSMCICGGETLLRKDICKIIRKLTDGGIPVNMVSNGYLMTEEKVKQLKEAGIKFIQISLDSFEEGEHEWFREKKGAYKNALNALELLNKYKIENAAAFCPNRINIDKFDEYVDEIVSRGCYTIRSMPLLPMGRGYDNFENLQPTQEQYNRYIHVIHKKMKRYSSKGVRIEWGDPLEHIRMALGVNQFVPISMEIKSDGDITPSIYIPVSIGNVKKHTLKEYWDNGFNMVWKQENINKIANSLKNIYDFIGQDIKVWSDERMRLDIMEGK